MLTTIQNEKSIFHCAVLSGSIDMLDYIDSILLVNYEVKRNILITDSSLLAESPLDIFLRLIEMGVEDCEGEHSSVIFDDLDLADQEKIIEVYTRKGWATDFADDYLVAGLHK